MPTRTPFAISLNLCFLLTTPRGVDDTAADYPGYVMAVDLHHRPEAELLRWAEAIKAVVKKDLGVDAELDTVLDRIDAKSI